MKLPGYPQKGKPVEDTVRGLIDYARATTVTGFVGGRVVRNANGTTIVAGKQKASRGGGGTLGPFWPALKVGGTAEAPTYSVTVTRGVVVDRVTTDADAVVYYEPVVLTTGEPTEFAITDTQYVCVKVATLDTGAIDGTPEIVVVDSDQESIHYIPPVGGATSGTAGEYYYKLAGLSFPSGKPTLTMFAAGDNIEHYRELPMFVKDGGTADVFKEFLAAEGKYKTRGITAGTGLTVTERTDDIEVKLDGDGWWGNVSIVWQPASAASPSDYVTLALSIEAGRVIGVTYGLDGGTAVTGTEATPGSASLVIQQ